MFKKKINRREVLRQKKKSEREKNYYKIYYDNRLQVKSIVKYNSFTIKSKYIKRKIKKIEIIQYMMI